MLIELTGFYTYTLESEDSGFQAHLSREQLEEDVELIHLQIKSDQAVVPPVFRLKWSLPVLDVNAMWHPLSIQNRALRADWSYPFEAKSASSAPVISLFNEAGDNRLTFAFSDALNVIRYDAGVSEETASFHGLIVLFDTPSTPVTEYTASLRVDKRPIPYYDSLNDVSRWWSSFPLYKPAKVPAVAMEPMYSTWYTFHQELTAEAIEQECRIAKTLGCSAVIVDDGWQTSDNARGYAYCGDWEVYAGKIPDMKAHVARVHQLGMKYILWYSVPFVGEHSKAWHQFQHKLLRKIDTLGAGVLDPRYPEVRQYLLDTYTKALQEWDLDGFKLDFIDVFQQPETENPDNDPGKDHLSVAQAADQLLSEIINKLSEIKPDIMIEFRQNYIGPLMRKYGNMFRAADCPNDAVQNRLRTVDIRLLCGDTAAHSDMMMWHATEKVDAAALQIINSLFSVPQISVMLETLPEEHMEMLRFWLDFWSQHRDTLLQGKLEPYNPEQLFPLVIARDDETLIAAVYCNSVVKLREKLPQQILVNGTRSDGIVIQWTEAVGSHQVTVKNCLGHPVADYQLDGTAGFHEIPVPPSGLAILKPV